MKQNLIAIYDRKTGLFERPFICRHIGEAIRDFEVIKKETNTRYGKHPEDFALIQIGEYDDEMGTVENSKPQITLSSGAPNASIQTN